MREATRQRSIALVNRQMRELHLLALETGSLEQAPPRVLDELLILSIRRHLLRGLESIGFEVAARVLNLVHVLGGSDTLAHDRARLDLLHVLQELEDRAAPTVEERG